MIDINVVYFAVAKIVISIKNVCSDKILTFGIKSMRSPAKVGIGYYKAVNYQPGS